MSKPVISIVMPVYRVEHYMRQAIDSILNQTFRNFELILVDDGSPDTCPQICDEYAQHDTRVKVIHQQNGGMGKACNAGMGAATGEYIGFVESDDWVEPDMYEKLYAKITKYNADMVKCGFWFYNPNKPIEKQNVPYDEIACPLSACPTEPFTIETYPKFLLRCYCHWAGLYRTDFIRQIKWVETAGASYQDIPFTVEALYAAHSIVIEPTSLLHYRVEGNGQGNSISRTDAHLLYVPQHFLYLKEKFQNNPIAKLERESDMFKNCLFQYKRIQLKHKYTYFKLFRQLMADVDMNHNPYMSKKDKKRLSAIQKGHFIRSIFTIKGFRHFMFSFHANKGYFLFQMLGIQITNSLHFNRPALFCFLIKKR